MKKKEKILVCPKCGSSNIEYASLDVRSGEIVGLGVPEKYYCRDCGYVGSIAIEIEKTKTGKLKKRKIKARKVKTLTVEELKPVYTAVIILFLIASIGLMLPKYEVKPKAVQGETITAIMNFSKPKEKPITQKLLIAKPSSIQEISRAIGYPSISGILLPSFLLVFISGLVVLMLLTYVERLKKFS